MAARAQTYRRDHPPHSDAGRSVMGTSNSYGGSGGGKPLIPTWLSDGGGSDGPQPHLRVQRRSHSSQPRQRWSR